MTLSRTVGDCFLILNLTIVVVAFVYLRSKWNEDGPFSWWSGTRAGDPDLPLVNPTGPIERRSKRRAAAPETRSGFALLRESDPDFDVDDFTRRVGEMFADLHNAAARRDLTPAARYIDSKAFAGLQARVAAIPLARTKAALTAERIKAVAVRRENDVDLVRVMITAVSDTPGTDPVTGCVLTEGDAVRFYAQEHWTLLRTVGARTLPDATIYRCPNCGAPVTASTRAECAYCHTRLCDQNRDWVVSDIAGD